MEKKPNRVYPAICELIEGLVSYSEYLNEPPYDAEVTEPQPYTLRFVIKSPQDKADAIIKMLFGDIEVAGKVGNRSFLQYDMALMKQCKHEMAETGKTREELLPKYIELAQARGASTTDESIRTRLINASQVLSRLEASEKKYEYMMEDVGAGFENFDEYDISMIWPWLHKYRNKVINLLKPELSSSQS